MKAYMTTTHGNGYLVLQDQDGTEGVSILVEPNGGDELILQQGNAIITVPYNMVPKLSAAMKRVVQNG